MPLDEATAAARIAARPRRRPPTSRSYASIVRANVFTLINLILASFGAVTVIFADWRDGLFLGILIANVLIGITQEVRAKRTLDRLALLVAPTALVVRKEGERRVHVDELVEEDTIRLAPGDQIVADARVIGADGLRVDESVVTGESEPVTRGAGDELRSGAFVVEGTAEAQIIAVGVDSYAERLLGEARRFRHSLSPLQLAVNRVLLSSLVLVFALGGLLGYALWHRSADRSETIETATAGVISLVPEGLVLLMSLTFAVGAVRFARRGVLAQQLNAIESLASADVICTDKTGTLTEAALRVAEVLPADGTDTGALEAALHDYASASATRNGTLEAIAAAYGSNGSPPTASAKAVAQVAFASRRRWSAVQLESGTLVMGAPELLTDGELATAAAERQEQGRRVVALARSRAPLSNGDGEPQLPADLQPLGVVVLSERLRDETRSTVEFLRAEGVTIKVLSGDAPATVAAIAADAGIEVLGVASGADLPEDPDELEQFAEQASVVGRISPEGKREVVAALMRRGHHVVMIGDGVNDVPALKAARLAIAQGSGTQIAKSIADLVLVDGNFAAVPGLIHEGRQTLRNLMRVAKLYVTKTGFAAFLVLTIGITETAYPLLPRHLSLAATVTIGVPTFFLALAPSSGPWRPDNFVREVGRYSVSAGVLLGVGVVSSYLFSLHDLELSVLQSRTVATSALVLAGLYLVLALEAHGRKRSRGVIAMCAALILFYVLVLALPFARTFFALATPTPKIILTALGASVVAIAALVAAGFTTGIHEPDGEDGVAEPVTPA